MKEFCSFRRNIQGLKSRINYLKRKLKKEIFLSRDHKVKQLNEHADRDIICIKDHLDKLQDYKNQLEIAIRDQKRLLRKISIEVTMYSKM